METIDSTLRVEVKFKNARLYNAIAAASVPINDSWQARVHHARGPVHAFCRLHALSYEQVSQLLRLKGRAASALARARRLPKVCERLAEILNLEVAYLFPPDLYKITWPSLVRELSHERFVALAGARRSVFELPPAQMEEVERRELRELISSALHMLTPRQQDVIERRYGLNGAVAHSLAEIGNDLGVSRETIRTIEAAALRKLRKPQVSRRLRPFDDDRRGRVGG